MVDVVWPLTSSPGTAPGEGAGRLINCYAYKDGSAPRWKPLPGLVPFASLPQAPVRGMLLSNNEIFAVSGRGAYQVTPNGDVLSLEEQVQGDGPVTIARNNASPPTIAITSNAGSYIIKGSVVKRYPDPNLPIANSLTFLDGYFIWTTSQGKIIASNENDTTIDPLSFANAEARPDGLLRGIVYGLQYLAMGEDTIEVYQDAGTLPFPLARSQVIQTGLIGQWAVAGYEPGWAGPLIFVAQDSSVRLLDGYTPTRISDDDLEALIAAVEDKSQLQATTYSFGGNAIWSLSGPSFTWEYNVTTQQWHERKSYGRGRWRGNLAVKGQNGWVVADETSGNLYTLDTAARVEGADPLIWGMDSAPVKQFPTRIAVPSAAFDFVLGQAPIHANPEAMLSWSHDGGATWANPVTRTLGTQGQFTGRVTINRCGLTSPAGIRWRFRVSDPAYSSFCGARMQAAGR